MAQKVKVLSIKPDPWGPHGRGRGFNPCNLSSDCKTPTVSCTPQHTPRNYFTLWETFRIHTWHSGKAKRPGLMLRSAAHPRQRLKSQTDLAELGSWHPKFPEAAKSEHKKGICLTLKNNGSTLWSHLKLISSIEFLKVHKYRSLSYNTTNDATR